MFIAFFVLNIIMNFIESDCRQEIIDKTSFKGPSRNSKKDYIDKLEVSLHMNCV
jgi:hypothetical protein